MNRAGRFVTSLALCALAACGGETAGPSSGYPTPSPLWSGGPCPTTGGFERTSEPLQSTGSIEILRPRIGEIVKGTKTVARVDLSGACLVEAAQRTVRPDTGHVHLYLDGKVVTQLAGLSYEITGLTPGTHLLEAELVDAAHISFQPRVTETVSFRVVKR